METFNVTIPIDNLVYLAGASEGTQVKYYKDNYWYKLDKLENEGLVEYLVSNVLRFSSLSEDDYVLYEYGVINGKSGCRSKNFLKNPEDSFITLQRSYSTITGRDLGNTLNNIHNYCDRFQYVIKFFYDTVGFDVTKTLKTVLTLDYLTLNTDRHFNNIGFIYTENGKIKNAPIFDNGMSLLNGCDSRLSHLSIAENVKRVVAQPFAGSHRTMLDYVGVGIKFDVNAAIRWLQQQEPSLYRDVLIYQFEINRELFNYKRN